MFSGSNGIERMGVHYFLSRWTSSQARKVSISTTKYCISPDKTKCRQWRGLFDSGKSKQLRFCGVDIGKGLAISMSGVLKGPHSLCSISSSTQGSDRSREGSCPPDPRADPEPLCVARPDHFLINAKYLRSSVTDQQHPLRDVGSQDRCFWSLPSPNAGSLWATLLQDLPRSLARQREHRRIPGLFPAGA